MKVWKFVKPLVFTATAFVMATSIARADKPEWAGEGGQPTAAEKEQHVEEMRSKNKGGDNKKNKKNKESKKNENKDKDSSEWEEERQKLEDNLRSNNRGMITNKPMN